MEGLVGLTYIHKSACAAADEIKKDPSPPLRIKPTLQNSVRTCATVLPTRGNKSRKETDLQSIGRGSLRDKHIAFDLS